MLYKKFNLWLITSLMTSISYVDAGKPSTPSTQQLQPVTPGTPSPTTPETNPANTPQSSGSNVSATDNTNQQGGFLSTSAGQAAVVGGVAGVGAMAVGIYVNEKLLSNTNSSVESTEKFLETLRLERKGRVAEVAAVIEDSEEILKNSRNFRKAIEQRTLTLPSNSLVTPPSYQIKKRLNQEELKTAIDNVRNNISNLKFNNTNYKGAFTMAQGKVINELSKNELSPAAYQWLSVLHRNGDLDNFAHRESLEQLLGHNDALQAEEADKKIKKGYTQW